MAASKRQLWPFEPRAAVIAVPILLVVLLLTFALLRAVSGWPGANAESALVVGILLFSLLPVVLFLVDLLAERGAVLEYKGIKLDLSRMSTGATYGSASVSTNIGVPERAVDDSSSGEILGALQEAVDHDVVVVDLKDGNAWWETRLLVLAAGAARRQRPRAIVFTGKESGIAGRFQGWAEPVEIRDRLLATNETYRAIFQAAEAAAQKWSLVEPFPAGQPPGQPPMPSWIDGLAAHRYHWAFEVSGMPSELRFERLLASELGDKVERLKTPSGISLVRLEELFRPILCKHSIDESSKSREQLDAFFSDDAPYIAVTRNGVYLRLLSRRAAVGAILKSLTVNAQSDE